MAQNHECFLPQKGLDTEVSPDTTGYGASARSFHAVAREIPDGSLALCALKQLVHFDNGHQDGENDQKHHATHENDQYGFE